MCVCVRVYIYVCGKLFKFMVLWVLNEAILLFVVHLPAHNRLI